MIDATNRIRRRRCKICGQFSPFSAEKCSNPVCGVDLALYGEVIFVNVPSPPPPPKPKRWPAVLAGIGAAIVIFALLAFVLPSFGGDDNALLRQPAVTEVPQSTTAAPAATQPVQTQAATTAPIQTDPPQTQPPTEPKEPWETNYLSYINTPYSHETVDEEVYSQQLSQCTFFYEDISSILRNDVRSITFLSTVKDAPADAWDVSAPRNGTVLAWAEPNGNLYDIFIAAEDGINVGSCDAFFAGCRNMVSVELNDAFRTDYVKEMQLMFASCEALQTLDLSSFNTANVENMSSLFYRCLNLTDVNLSSFDTSNVTDMSRMFYRCNSLSNLNVSSFKTEKVSKMRYMFFECSGLTDLDISSFDTSNVCDMAGMFRECTSIQTLDLSSFITTNANDMYLMFCQCTSLTDLDIRNFDTSKVQNMGGMFRDCTKLKELDLSHFVTSSVTDMHTMFYNTASLQKLNISSFDTSNVTDMSWMFMVCPPINAEDVQHFNTDKVTNYENFMRGTEWMGMFQ